MILRRTKALIFAITICLLPTYSYALKKFEPSLDAQPVVKLNAQKEDGTPEFENLDEYGKSVASNGEYLVVGSQYANYPDNTSKGAAYVYKKENDTWVIHKKLPILDNNKASDIAKAMGYGYSVAISDKYIAVGAYLTKTDTLNKTGAVYIYGKDEGGTGNWGFLKKLVAMESGLENPTEAENFGKSVAFDGDLLAVGAPGSYSVTIPGSVYIFSAATGWTNIKKITALKKGGANDKVNSAYFGAKVVFDNDTLAVSAIGKAVDAASNCGTVYIYNKNAGGVNDSWDIVNVVIPMKNNTDHDASESLFFGGSLSLSGDILAVGAQRKQISETSNAGRVYLYSKDKGEENNWGFITALDLSDGDLNSAKFGSSVSISGDTIAVGAEEFDDDGRVFVYTKQSDDITKWNLAAKINAKKANGEDDDASHSEFGISVDLNDKNLFVGATKANVGNNVRAGAAYVYNLKEIKGSDDGDKDNVVFKTNTQPKGVSVTVHENHKEAKTRDQLKSEFNTGSLDTMLGANIYEFDADVTPLELGYFGFITTSLGERKAGDVTLFKLYPDKASREFTYSSDKTPTEEGFFWITDHNNSDQYIDPNTVLEGGRAYTINYSVRDNGEFDLNPAAGTIHDPVVPGTSSGGSGCVLNPQAGMSVELAGFFIAALIGICARRFRRQ